MPTTCDIEFQNNVSNIVYAGQELWGTVRLTLTEEKHLRGIYIQIYGNGFCQWTAGRTTHTRRADYLNEIIYLLGNGNGDVRVAPNTYTYNFKCLLPAQLPGSVEGKFGHVRYSASAVLKSFSLFPDKKFKRQFCVFRQLNLNEYPALRQPIFGDANYKCRLSDFLCFCRLCTIPPKIFAKIPISGYVPLQLINIEIHVKSRSGELDCEFEVKLIKLIHYFCEQPKIGCCQPVTPERKEKQIIVGKTVCARIESFEGIINVDLQVPPTPPSNFLSNNIMNATYYISICGRTGLCNQISKIKLPVTIGSYPIQNVEQNSNAVLSSAPPEHLVFGNSSENDPTSYVEAITY